MGVSAIDIQRESKLSFLSISGIVCSSALTYVSTAVLLDTIRQTAKGEVWSPLDGDVPCSNLMALAETAQYI